MKGSKFEIPNTCLLGLIPRAWTRRVFICVLEYPNISNNIIHEIIPLDEESGSFLKFSIFRTSEAQSQIQDRYLSISSIY